MGHQSALKFDNRPFSSLEEETNAIISNWNSVVSDNDNVYILGDMFWNNALIAPVMSQLKGHKFLICGNHDRLNSILRPYFVWVKDMDVVKDGEDHVVLCHYPIAHWKNADYGYIMLYGHIHEGRDSRPFGEYVQLMKQRGIPYECYNVGCMMPYMEYTPRTLEYLKKSCP